MTQPQRSVRYYVVGQGDMSLADRNTWGISASNATTIQDLKTDLHGEPFVPKHYAVMVERHEAVAGLVLAGWATEKGMQGQELPSGALDVRIVPLGSSLCSLVCGCVRGKLLLRLAQDAGRAA